VIDAKNSWGKVRVLVQPLAGTGQQWIELGRLMGYSTATESRPSRTWEVR
jgi:hypothetical protein